MFEGTHWENDAKKNVLIKKYFLKMMPNMYRSIFYLVPMVWNIKSILHCKAACTGPRSTVGNVSGNRCESDCRSSGNDFDPGPVPYFRGNWLWNNFYGVSPPFRWIIQEGLLSVTSKSMCTKYWLTACLSFLRKKVWLGELTIPPWPYLLAWDVKQ